MSNSVFYAARKRLIRSHAHVCEHVDVFIHVDVLMSLVSLDRIQVLIPNTAERYHDIVGGLTQTFIVFWNAPYNVACASHHAETGGR